MSIAHAHLSRSPEFKRLEGGLVNHAMRPYTKELDRELGGRRANSADGPHRPYPECQPLAENAARSDERGQPGRQQTGDQMSDESSSVTVSEAVGGPVQAVLMASVARRFYLEGVSKVDIAKELKISRFKVARLLEEALRTGLVRIEIGAAGDVDLDLSARLAEALGLHECLVVETGTTAVPQGRQRLAVAAAAYVSEVLVPGDVLGMTWAREVYAMVGQLTRLPRVEVVQLCGAAQLPDDDASPVESVVQAARLAGTKGHVFFAPLIVDDEEAAAAVLRQPSVGQALAQARRVTRAVVGIGRWAPQTSTIHDAVRPHVRADVHAAGAIGEIAGVFFDAEGSIVRPELSRRVVSIGEEALLAIPHVCGIVLGAAKEPAVRAAVRGGIVDSLVVDSALGRALLDG